MLLEYGFKNYFSFREGAQISFRLDANCPSSISGNKSFTRVLAVKGANAAGKTHVLRALAFLSRFVPGSFSDGPDSIISLDSFFGSEAPSEFYVEFMSGDTTYRYELEATERAVIRETIYRTKQKRVKIIERIRNEIVYMPAKLATLRSVILRDNASIVSTLTWYKMDLLQEVASFFNKISSNVGYGGLFPERSAEYIAKLLHDKPYLQEYVAEFLKKCDVGIDSVRIVQFKEEGGVKYVPYFEHSVSGTKHSIHHLNESSGTLKLFRVLPTYFLSLISGGVTIYDEFDMHLHPDLLPLMVDLFLDPETNKGGGQLIFTTHDSALLDKLGRYRTYLVNKEENESYAYRLDSIPGDILRNDRPIRPVYEAGKIGGVPRL